MRGSTEEKDDDVERDELTEEEPVNARKRKLESAGGSGFWAGAVMETEFLCPPYLGGIALVKLVSERPFEDDEADKAGFEKCFAELLHEERWPLADASCCGYDLHAPRAAEPERTWLNGDSVHYFRARLGVWVRAKVVASFDMDDAHNTLVTYYDWSLKRNVSIFAWPDELRSDWERGQHAK